ncbi:MAG: S8 family serine peptidase [Flavobacteriales bacterium]|nr:S8 family serine peptidase [Flavobacteriales bacterium]MCB9447756.1 S8 family serine peptidase [Flavobacteriales bacterium]
MKTPRNNEDFGVLLSNPPRSESVDVTPKSGYTTACYRNQKSPIEKHINLMLALVLTWGMSMFWSPTIQAQQETDDFEAGQIYVKLKDNVACRFAKQTSESVAIESLPALVPLTEKYGVTALARPFYFSKSDVLARTYTVTFSKYEDVMQLIHDLEQDPTVEYAERIPVKHLDYSPNDPLYSQSNMWHLFKIRAAEAWDITKGDPNIIVAMVDGAISVEHSDLKPVIWNNADEIPGNGKDDDNNGFVDDYRGWDFGQSDNDPSPESTTGNNWNHGSHTSGIAGAATDNNNGIASIGAGITLMPLKTGYECGGVCLKNTTQAITYAADNGANVISMSFGSTSSSQTEQNAITYAYNKGCVLVGSAGNTGSQSNNYPGTYTEVIGVANTTENDTKNSGSTYGTWVDLSAPGTNIYSTGYPSSYYNNTGTSMSAPLVSGLAGLMLSANPNLTPAEVKQCLKSTAINIDNLNPSYAGKLGSGRIDALGAVQCASQGTSPTANFTSSTGGSCDGVISFTDKSSNATSWSWNFGDGGSSTQQNPTHTYTASGTYTVTLTATNTNGSDSKSLTVTISLLTTPTTQGDVTCNAGTVNLSATGGGTGITYHWYDAASGGNLVNTGTTYNPNISSTTTYYVAATDVQGPQSAGPSDNSIGAGGYFTANSDHGLFFDALQDIKLKSVKVYANTAGSRTIEVLDAQGGNVLHTITLNLPAGESRADLNFDISAASGMFIKISGATIDLYRNSAGASFPYTVSNVVSITGNSATDAGYYYYFYDWEVQLPGCESARTSVTGTVVNLSKPTITSDATTLTCDQSGLTYAWYMGGSVISGANGMVYTPAQNGYYQVMITDGNGCTALSDSVYWQQVGIADDDLAKSIHLYPNPNQGVFNIDFNLGAPAHCSVVVTNLLGERVYASEQEVNGHLHQIIEMSKLNKGMYLVQIQVDSRSMTKKLVIN